MWVLLNGELIPDTHALVSIFDRGFMYGDGVFETMRAYNGIVFGLQAHLDRLAKSAAALRMALPRPAGAMRSDIGRVLARNDLGEAVIRIAVSRGAGARGVAVPSSPRPTYTVTAEPVPGGLSEKRRRGLSLKVVEVRKIPGSCLPSYAKHSNYLNSILAHSEAVEGDADDGIMLTVDGHVAECATSNLFVVTGGTLCTPSLDAGVLPGIIRAVVLSLAPAAGLDISERRFDVDRLLSADEVFVTNSVVELLPVRRIETRAYPVPGPETGRLIRLLGERIAAETGSFTR